jgi:general transcription factor 3C polypeptide 3 (transcription factor C subunit 4)
MTDEVEDRHNSILRALTFLDTYKRLRAQHSTQAEGEALFNIGRAFHHLGLVTQACACYKRVVQIPSVQSLQALPEGMVPSVHERASAYNLILLYHQSGQKTLALSVMRAFLSV